MKGEDGHTPAEGSTVGTSHLTGSGGLGGQMGEALQVCGAARGLESCQTPRSHSR